MSFSNTFFLICISNLRVLSHMNTITHTRNRQYRNLYRAVPVRMKFETRKVWERETKKLVDVAYAAFWEKRKLKAPWVSKETVGAFDSIEEGEVK